MKLAYWDLDYIILSWKFNFGWHCHKLKTFSMYKKMSKSIKIWGKSIFSQILHKQKQQALKYHPTSFTAPGIHLTERHLIAQYKRRVLEIRFSNKYNLRQSVIRVSFRFWPIQWWDWRRWQEKNPIQNDKDFIISRRHHNILSLPQYISIKI